eukprot:1589-Heterococcus_DN1.PRE.4
MPATSQQQKPAQFEPLSFGGAALPMLFQLTLLLSICSTIADDVCDARGYHVVQRPAAFEGCGSWQESYMKLHQRILAGEQEPRFLVSVSVEGGLADRITGIITEFYFALLTNRAFQITNAQLSLPKFEAAYDAPFISWTRHVDDPAILTEHLRLTYKGIRRYKGVREFPSEAQIDTSKFWSMYLVDDEPVNEFYESSDLRQMPEGHANVSTLFVASNRGRVFRLFDNPYHKKVRYLPRVIDYSCLFMQAFNMYYTPQCTLSQMGLRPDTAFACAFNFLFAPNDAVKAAYQYESGRLSTSTNDDALSIGINFRLGDWAFDAAKDKEIVRNLDAMQGVFDCADAIAASRRASNATKVVWYVTADSAHLRRLILDQYGADVVVTQTQPHSHGDCQHMHESCAEQQLNTSIIMAAGQLWSMAMTDYQIFTRDSGFGRLGAMLSKRWHSMYALHPGEYRACGKHDYDSLEVTTADWAGI